MPDNFLLKRQRAELASAIVERGLQASDFVDGFWSGIHVGYEDLSDAWAIRYKGNAEYVRDSARRFRVLRAPDATRARVR